MSQSDNSSPPPPEETSEVLPSESPDSQSSVEETREIQRTSTSRSMEPAGGSAALPFIECYRCGTRVYLWSAMNQEEADELVEVCPGCGEHLRIARVKPVSALQEGKKAPPLRERRPELKGKKELVFVAQDRLQGLLPEETEESIRKRRRRELALIFACFGACFLVGGYLGWSVGIKPPPPKPLLGGFPQARGPLMPSETSVASPEEEKAARETLEAFLNAAPMEERLSRVLDPQRVAPLMERYYRFAEDDASFLKDVQWRPAKQPADDLRRGILILERVIDPQTSPAVPRHPLLLFFKREPGETNYHYRLDWETYVQERERLLMKFLANPESPPGVFRVELRRKHVFGLDSSPGALPPLGCSVRPLLVRDEFEAVIPAGHPLYERFNRELKWTFHAPATVKLQWTKLPGQGEPRLEIADFYCWEFAGVGRIPEKTLDSITLPDPSGQSSRPAAAEKPEGGSGLATPEETPAPDGAGGLKESIGDGPAAPEDN